MNRLSTVAQNILVAHLWIVW